MLDTSRKKYHTAVLCCASTIGTAML
eukprot:IDg2918t1